MRFKSQQHKSTFGNTLIQLSHSGRSSRFRAERIPASGARIDFISVSLEAIRKKDKKVCQKAQTSS